MRSWPARRWLVAAGTAALSALILGGLTDVIPNPLIGRMTPVPGWSYPTLVVTSLQAGLIAATYLRSPAEPVGGTPTSSGGILTFLAISCPACNKAVVFALGASGALNIWAPLQPVLAIVSIVLLGWALRIRLAAERSCPAPARRAMPMAQPQPPRAGVE